MDSASNSRDSFGADIESASFLWAGPLGSFGGGDTPPRSGSLPGSARGSPRASPPQGYQHYPSYLQFPGPFNQHGYRPNVSYMPFGRNPSGRLQHAYQQGYGAAQQPYYYDVSVDQIWNSPPPIEDSFAPHRGVASASPGRLQGTSKDASTPEKVLQGGPFRSPPSKMGFGRSPIQGSPKVLV
jgi:hypothetical protein